MKKVLLACGVVLALASPVAGQEIIRESAIGQLWWNSGNEAIMDSKIADASKFRVGAPFELDQSGGGGAFSFDVIGGLPGQPAGKRVEVVLLTGSMNRTLGGEMGISILKKGTGQDITDAAQIKVAEFYSDHIEFKVPITAPGFGGGGVTGSVLMSPNGRFRTQFQDDGHIVIYDTWDSRWVTDPSAVAVWSSWYGLLRPLPWETSR